MTIATLLDLYDHMAWADATVWSAVLNDDRARTDDKLTDLLRHVHTAQRFFLRVWRGEPMDAPFPVFEQMPSLCDWARTYHAEARAYLAPLTDASLCAPMPEAWTQRMERLLGASPAAASPNPCLSPLMWFSRLQRPSDSGPAHARPGRCSW